MLAPRLPKSKAQGTEELSEGHPSAGQTPPVPWAASTGDTALRVRILSLHLQGEMRPVWLTSRRRPGSPPAKVLLNPHPRARKEEASQPTFLWKNHFRAQVWPMAHVRDGRPALVGMTPPAPVSLDLLTLDHMPIICLYPGCVFLGGHSASPRGDTQPSSRDIDQAGVLPCSVCCEHVCGPLL